MASKSLTLTSKVSYLSVPILVLLSLVFPLMYALRINANLPLSIKIRIFSFGRFAIFNIKNFYDIVVLHEIFVERQYDVNFLSEPDIIVDLGSNVGASIVFFKLKYPNAKIYGFEPDPVAFSKLQENVKQFGSSVTLNQKTVTEKTGLCDFFTNPASSSSSIFKRSSKSIKFEIESIKLDDILGDISEKDSLLIKFDVEGAEGKIFSACNLHERIDYIVGEFHADLMPHQTEEKFSLYFPKHELRFGQINKGRSLVKGELKSTISL